MRLCHASMDDYLYAQISPRQGSFKRANTGGYEEETPSDLEFAGQEADSLQLDNEGKCPLY